MKHLLDAASGAKFRALIRAIAIAITAFGVKLPAEQVAAVQLVLEAVLGIATAATPNLPVDPPEAP